MCIVYICFVLFAIGFNWIITVVSFYLDKRSAGFLFLWAASQAVSQAARASQDVERILLAAVWGQGVSVVGSSWESGVGAGRCLSAAKRDPRPDASTASNKKGPNTFAL